MKNVVQVAIFNSVRVIFYKKVRRLKLAKGPKFGENAFFFVFEKQPGGEGKKEIA